MTGSMYLYGEGRNNAMMASAVIQIPLIYSLLYMLFDTGCIGCFVSFGMMNKGRPMIINPIPTPIIMNSSLLLFFIWYN